jgi:signal transduction histidine kinase
MATILVVDDRAPDRELLSLLLSHGQHQVLEAADSAEALRLLRAEHPDLVISDVLLPKMDGYELVRQMHLDPAISETTVIFYTAAFNEQEARDLARECGVTLLLSKPTDPKIILEKVAEVLNGKGVKGVTSLPASFEQRHQELLVDKLLLQVEALHRNEEALRRSHEELGQRVEERTAALNAANKQLNHEIELRHRVEYALRLSHYFLEIVNRHIEVQDLLQEFAAEVKKFAQCSAVGIRLLDEAGNMTYNVNEGFPQGFYDLEGPLSIKSDQCMCINVINGTTNPRPSYYTPKGSYYLNGTTRFLATVSEEEKGKARNICNLFGYESVALVPIRAGNKVMGLIYLADPKENKVQLEKVVLLERIALQLGAALQRILSQQELMQLRSSFTSRLLDAQESERRRISYELHEELGQSLTALKLQLRGVEKNLPPGGMKEELGHSLDYINEVIENVRCLSQDLRPSILEHMGLAAALKNLADKFSEHSQIPVALELDSIQGLLGPEAEVSIYRIFQECFTNIAKHAQAALVSVSIKRLNGQVTFRVEDNGRGFDSQQMLKGDITKWGLGLSAMAERMRMLNGNLDIWSQEGQGTGISFAVPVKGN